MDDDAQRDSRMLLNASHGIGPVIFSRLMASFENNPARIISALDSELLKVNGIGKNTIESMREKISSGWLDKEKQKMEKMGAQFIHTNQLPEHLEQLMDPPTGLYTLGEVPKSPCISIVGTRYPSNYGKKFARKIAFELAKSGICIVSGMARGIDSEAHWGALEAEGSTMAFLGSGIDIVYPPENLELYKKIQVSGAILSEFPIGRRADRRTFPMRNRLVAGVSLGVLVIESAKSGGSMITAKFAAEQGRTVFSLPGRIDHPESQGCLDLIRDGATLIRNTHDILEELKPMLQETKLSNVSLSGSLLQDCPTIDEKEQQIMQVFSDGERYDTEDLQRSTKLTLSEIIPSITMLEIRGMVTKRPDGKYEGNL